MRVPPLAQLTPAGSSLVFTKVSGSEPPPPPPPLQTYSVVSISLASKNPLSLSSSPFSMRVPPLAQFTPAGSTLVFTKASGSEPPPPPPPLQAYSVVSTSLASKNPLSLSSSPFSMRVPPLTQLTPAGSSLVFTKASGAEPPLPPLPLQTYSVVSISLASKNPLSLSSIPFSIRVPPFAQFAPTGSTLVFTKASGAEPPPPPRFSTIVIISSSEIFSNPSVTVTFATCSPASSKR